MTHSLQQRQDEAIERANELKVMAIEAGVHIPMGCMKVSFSDGSHVLMSKAQFQAIKES